MEAGAHHLDDSGEEDDHSDSAHIVETNMTVKMLRAQVSKLRDDIGLIKKIVVSTQWKVLWIKNRARDHLHNMDLAKCGVLRYDERYYKNNIFKILLFLKITKKKLSTLKLFITLTKKNLVFTLYPSRFI